MFSLECPQFIFVPVPLYRSLQQHSKEGVGEVKEVQCHPGSPHFPQGKGRAVIHLLPVVLVRQAAVHVTLLGRVKGGLRDGYVVCMFT